MRSPTWKRCSACAAHLTQCTSPIPQRFSHVRGCVVKRQGSIDLIPWKSLESQNASEMNAPPSVSASKTGIAIPWEDLRAIAGAEHLRAAWAGDGVAGVQPQMVFEPNSETELAAALRFGDATGLGVVPRGGGTKTCWGNPPVRADLILSTARLNRVIEYAWADLTVSVEAGCTIQNLQNALAERGQRVAVDPLWPERATVGGILSTNDSGSLRIRYGALRDLIIGVTIALPDGTLASSGGKVVKNVAGYDLPKLATGALGTLGVITRANFRLHPLPRNIRSFTFAARDVGDASRVMLAVQDSWLTPTGLQARFTADAAPAVDVRFEGTDAGLAAQAVSCGNWPLQRSKPRPATRYGRRGRSCGLRQNRQRSQNSAFYRRRSQKRVAAFVTWPIPWAYSGAPLCREQGWAGCAWVFWLIFYRTPFWRDF